MERSTFSEDNSVPFRITELGESRRFLFSSFS